MAISRRGFLRLVGAAGCAFACASRGLAGNSAGLAPGSFVWQPSLAPAGPLLITFSAGEELVRVYRGGLMIGISTCRIGAGRRGREWEIINLSRARETGRGNRLQWFGTALCADSTSGGSDRAWPMLVVPDEFARLLHEAEAGNVAVLVRGDTVGQCVAIEGGFLLPRGVSLVSTQTLDRPRAPVAAVPPAQLVVSTRDRVATLRRHGEPDITGGIAIRGQAPLVVDRLLSLVEMGRSAESTRWLAIDLAASEVSNEDLLERVSLEGDRVTPLMLASVLTPGSTMLFTDGPALRPARKDGARLLLASEAGSVPPARGPAKRLQRRRRATVAEVPAVRPLKFFRDY